MALFGLSQTFAEEEGPEPQPGGTGPTFKECYAREVAQTFFNLDEFAEIHNVDGVDAPVVMEALDLEERAAHWEAGAKQNFDTGLYTGLCVLYIRIADYGEAPLVDGFMVIDEDTENERTYTVKSCEEEGGIYRITLERTRQG